MLACQAEVGPPVPGSAAVRPDLERTGPRGTSASIASPGSACTMAKTNIDSRSKTGISCRTRYVVYLSISGSFAPTPHSTFHIAVVPSPTPSPPAGRGSEEGHENGLRHAVAQKRHVAPLRLDIGGANAAAMVREGSHHTGRIALQLLGRRRRHGQLMQVEMRQLDVDNVPGLGIQRLALGLIERPFGFFRSTGRSARSASRTGLWAYSLLECRLRSKKPSGSKR